MEYKEYGHWSTDGREFVITERKTPRHWYNYYFNDTYNAFASQVGFGSGFCEDRLANRVKLVVDRCVYIADKKAGTWHTAVGLPMREPFDRYECRHGLGYSTILCEKNGIESEYTVFVPEKGEFEQWIVKVTNRRAEAADLGVIAYAATDTDGRYEPQGYNSQAGTYNVSAGALCHRVSTRFGENINTVTCAYMMCDAEISAYDCRKNAFIGVYGNKECPEALEEGNGCKNSDTCVEKLCFALETPVRLEAGESKTVSFRIGHTMKESDLFARRADFESVSAQTLLTEVIEARRKDIAGVEIQTPDEKLNLAFNSFYRYATVMGSRWARVRHNGYRDTVNDTECLATFHPKLARERFKRILTYQYATGYAPRTILDGKIQSNNYIDCAVWLAPAAHTIVTELGDLSFLQESVAFNDGSEASIFEHLRRAVQYLYDFHAENGLIKLWGGDWHDGLNWAGLDGKGCSIWLSIAWYRSNNHFVELAEMIGEEELAKTHRQMGEQMRERIERYGFDGKYYLEAISDDGVKIGSHESDEMKMWLVPQVWAVMAGIAPKEKLLSIMEEVDAYLECPYGTLNAKPACTRCDPRLGNYTRQPAGTLLNESVYLQPMTWKITAEAILGRRDKLQMSLEKLLPWNHKYGVTYGEPYILYNFYYTEKSGYRAGVPGQSWRTATAHCLVRTIVRYIYGLVPTLEGLCIDPCLPPDWKECSITKDFRGCTYEIAYHQEKGDGSIRVLVNGEAIEGTRLPYCAGTRYRVDVFC